ncbi:MULTISPECIES: glycosyltransferase family 1 protein [Bacillus cereus group]|uniref:glycosyltransferase family 1 protein n=1 Tax=Bacillus cereus group TaxID=86661 RepID=UPI0008FE80ED|nr:MULTISPECIES: glycosyltransferase family 1 protein [Bacillus cereus group]MDG1621865.1 glycosyltransferase family 1 protein [Bacillus mobilis]MDX5839698.1 glycosyltransferase family 1 protein [Bacillus cereus group sp. BfR-BA-01700]MED4385820.1 glycosyltransferase family 1 protein [Bacillus mobilis]OJE45292.1 glycosyl transferase family 1 [Bacillus mobilis]HDR7242805.1 glycosyltransferase family 1 protein [Bacillus mobilis]
MGAPLRVLHVVVNMNRGGAETLIMNLYRNIDRSKVQFDFLTCKEGVFDEEIVKLGGKVHRIPYVTDVGHRGYIKALDTFFSTHPHYKIVHSHMDKMSGFVLRSAKKARVPVRIAHSHSTSSEGGAIANIYKWYAGAFIKSCATHFLACSVAAAQWLFANRESTTKILKNGIECDEFTFNPDLREQVRKELKLHGDVFVIGHVGRFAYPKNHTFLIDIFAQLIEYRPNSILLLVGDGPLRLEMEKKVEKLNLTDKVKFLGIRSDINRLLQAFDAFLFPSIYEGLPVTLIEAQGAGLPCIISDTITQDVDLGLNLVEQCSLLHIRNWVGLLQTIENKQALRSVEQYVLAEKGYDIKNITGCTQEFYVEVSR